GDGHAAGDGKLRVLVSNDGESWSSSALVGEAGGDFRGPQLFITPRGRLMMGAGGSGYARGGYKSRPARVRLSRGGGRWSRPQPRVSFSSDGVDWTAPQRILSEGDWLWRVTWRQGRAYGVSYLSAGSATRSGFLYSSADGIHYQRITEFKAPGVSEVTLRFLLGGEMVALARRESDNKHGWIGSSRPPYTDWEFHEIPRRLGGPNFIQLPNGDFWSAGREHFPDGPKTILARMTMDSYARVLTLPSGGDNSYPGLVWYDNLLWMSYYSSHEGKASIYV